MPEEAAEIIVTIMILATFILFANMVKVDPPLKKSQLTRRKIVPKTTKGIEFG